MTRILSSSILLFSFLFFSVTPAIAKTISVNPGDSIQTKCLDVVQAGDICEVNPGNYNSGETLTLKTTGTKDAPITLRCTTPKTCIVNSGSNLSLITQKGKAINHYTIDGFSLLSTSVTTENNPMAASVSTAYYFWGDGDNKERGNDHFIFRNMYVEGSIYFYGSDNLVENSEFNGKNRVLNGVTERSQPSENNIFRNNYIHDYLQRCGWSLQYTRNSLWENNTLNNCGSQQYGGMGIDCDGAGHPVYKCDIKNNTINNTKGEAAIHLENTFDSEISGNIVSNTTTGINYINYNRDNDDGFSSDGDYKDIVTNTITKNNLIYNTSNEAIICKAVRGNTFIHNTIHNSQVQRGWFGAIGLSSYTQVPCKEWSITNNIISQSPKTVWLEQKNITTNHKFNYNLYSPFTANVENAGWSKSFSQWQALSYDQNSLLADPMFVDPSQNNFHLKPESKACNLGPNGDYAGAFPCNNTSPSPSPIPGDLTGDGHVNLSDFNLLIAKFGNPYTLSDYNALVSNFGR